MLARRIMHIRPGMGRVVLAAAGPQPSNYKKHASADFSTAKTYAKHPKLPVPDSQETLQNFLEFAKPLQSKQEYAQTEQAVKKFSQDELPKLQSLLEKRAGSVNNWLTPWWLNVAYLAARTPLPVVTSPGLMFPHFPFDGIDGQIEHAAKIAQAAVTFHLKVLRNEIPQDMAGKVPFDMSQYKFLFGTTRVPKRGADELVLGCNSENRARHIVVMRNGHVFTLDVLDKEEKPIGLSELKSQLKRIVEESEEKQANPIGVVSSDHRDRWADTYESLKKNPKNASNLARIEEALFVVCLDQASEPLIGRSERDEQARQALHGGGSSSNSCNRWFDKTIQFLLTPNGYFSMTYEHTPAEGPPVANLMDYVLDQFDHNTFLDAKADGSSKVERLDFELNEEHKTRIAKSSKKIDSVAADLDLLSYTFKRCGKNFPKSVKISPDSFIQMAFQLAFYRIHSSVPPTYETATLRKFDEGRTENIRSPNILSQTFVKKMASGRVPISELYESLKAAADSHKKYTIECMNGQGMDRHLLAWNLLAAENNLLKPSILDSPVYEQLTHFQVSTSQVPTRHVMQMCFGPSAPDCYGVCYNPHEKELHFTISTFKSEGSTSSKKFAKELERALNDMISVCSKALKEQSKL